MKLKYIILSLIILFSISLLNSIALVDVETSLNIRNEPNLDSNIKFNLNKNEIVIIIYETDKFSKSNNISSNFVYMLSISKFPNSGYAFKYYLKKYKYSPFYLFVTILSLLLYIIIVDLKLFSKIKLTSKFKFKFTSDNILRFLNLKIILLLSFSIITIFAYGFIDSNKLELKIFTSSQNEKIALKYFMAIQGTDGINENSCNKITSKINSVNLKTENDLIFKEFSESINKYCYLIYKKEIDNGKLKEEILLQVFNLFLSQTIDSNFYQNKINLEKEIQSEEYILEQKYQTLENKYSYLTSILDELTSNDKIFFLQNNFLEFKFPFSN